MTFPSDRNNAGDESGRPQTGYSALAILSVIVAFLFPPLGIVFGHVAKRQIRRTGEQGDGLATAGLVIGYLITALVLVACCGAAVVVATGWATVPGLT